MSIEYDIMEHLTVKEHCKEAESIKGVMQWQIALVGMLSLLDAARFFHIKLTADGETTEYSKDMTALDLKTIIGKMEYAKDVDLFFDYSFTWRVSYDALNVGPFAMCDYLNSLSEEERDGAFYCMYNYADSDADDAGIVAAYGKKNGTDYHGVLPYHEIEDLPNDGRWLTPLTALQYETESLDGIDIAQIEQVFQTIEASFDGAKAVYHTKGKYVSIWLDCIELRSSDELKRFAALVGKLVRLTDDHIGCMPNFYDAAAIDPRLLWMHFDHDGNATFSIAEA